jgi:hypothetical protein
MFLTGRLKGNLDVSRRIVVQRTWTNNFVLSLLRIFGHSLFLLHGHENIALEKWMFNYRYLKSKFYLGGQAKAVGQNDLS